MKTVFTRTKDFGVSEIIGTILIFAISVSFFTTVLAWYVPATASSNDANFQASEQSGFASLISQIESGGLSPGTQITQDIPMGVPGEFLNAATPSQLSFNNSGFSMNVSYDLQLGYNFLSNKEPSSVSNVLFSTIPGISGRGPINSIYVKGNIYVTDFSSNSISVINGSTGHLVKQIYAGIEPYGLTYDNQTNDIYVTDFFSFYNSLLNRNYSTITVISLSTMNVVDTINLNGTDIYLDNPTGIAYDGQSGSPNYGYIFVSGYEHIMYNKTNGAQKIPYYEPWIVVINPSTNQPVSSIGNIQVLPASDYSYSRSTFATDVFVYNYSSALTLSTGAPLDGTVLVTNYVNNSIFVIPTFKDNSTDYYVTGNHDFANPIDITINPNNGSLFVVNYANNSTNSPLNTQQHYLPITPGAGNRPFTTVPPQQQAQSPSFSNGNITELQYNSSLLNLLGAPELSVTNVLKVSLHNPIGIAYHDRYLYVTDNAGYYNNTSQYSYSELTVVNASNPIQNYTVNENGSLKLLLNPYSINYFAGLNKFVITLNGTNSIALFHSGSNSTSGFNKSKFEKSSQFYFTGELNAPVALADYGNYLFVANRLSDKVSAYNIISGSIVQTFSVGINPDALCFVPNAKNTGGTLFVANNGSNNITVLVFNGKTLSLVKSIYLGPTASPDGMALNTKNNLLYVTDYGTSQVTLLNVTNYEIQKTINLATGSEPIDASYATGTNLVLVSDYGNANVTIFTGTSILTNISVQKGPDSVAYDPQTRDWYVTNFYSGNVTVIGYNSHSKLSVLFLLQVGVGPDGITYDPFNEYIYVSNFYSDNITLYNAPFNITVDSIAIGGGPIGTMFDSINGFIYTPDFATNQISVVEGGTVFYNANGSGEHLVNTYTSDGYFSSYTYTSFADPIQYLVEGGNLITYNSAKNISNALLSLPISVVGGKSNPVIRLTSVSILGNDTSISQSYATQIKLDTLSATSVTYYPGDKILYRDFYNNSYTAEVTSLNLSSLSIDIYSTQVQAWNSMFYSIFNNSNGNSVAPSTWKFSEYPFQVSVSGNNLLISELGNSFFVNSASIVNYVFVLEAL